MCCLFIFAFFCFVVVGLFLKIEKKQNQQHKQIESKQDRIANPTTSNRTTPSTTNNTRNEHKTSPDGVVAKSSVKGLVGTEFGSRYRLQFKTDF